MTQRSLLDIVRWPNEGLHKQCFEVVYFDQDEIIDGSTFLAQLGEEMITTMYHYYGYGLAAPQVGEHIRMLVMLTSEPDEQQNSGDPIVLINPEVLEQSEEMFSWKEGCISVPGYFEIRSRPNKITVEFKDPKGNTHQRKFEGVWAFVFLHELDHLNGKVFIDDLSNLKKSRIKNKINKTLRRQRR